MSDTPPTLISPSPPPPHGASSFPLILVSRLNSGASIHHHNSPKEILSCSASQPCAPHSGSIHGAATHQELASHSALDLATISTSSETLKTKTSSWIIASPPFSALMMRFRLQDQAGLTLLDLRGDFVPHWSSQSGWTYGYEALLNFERILISLNDTPLSLRLAASLGNIPSTEEDDLLGWEAHAGLLWALPLN